MKKQLYYNGTPDITYIETTESYEANIDDRYGTISKDSFEYKSSIRTFELLNRIKELKIINDKILAIIDTSLKERK